MMMMWMWMSGIGRNSNTARYFPPFFFLRCSDVQACKINYPGLIPEYNWLEKGASPGKPASPTARPHGKTVPSRRLGEPKIGHVPSVWREQNKGGGVQVGE